MIARAAASFASIALLTSCGGAASDAASPANGAPQPPIEIAAAPAEAAPEVTIPPPPKEAADAPDAGEAATATNEDGPTDGGAQQFGMIGLLEVGDGGANALGGLIGDGIGESFGAGGLGLSGIGPGGGGRGEGIGIGTIGGVGHGGGTGSGQGYGSGHGRVGASKQKPPSLRMGTAAVGEGLPPEIVQRIVRQSFGRFRLCYERGLQKDPKLAGRVVARFDIAKDGSVVKVEKGPGTKLSDDTVVTCILHGFEGLSFPEPEAGVVVRVTYPLDLKPGS